MSEPVIIISSSAGYAVSAGVVAIVGALWWQVRGQISDLREQLTDAVAHIRQLENLRVADQQLRAADAATDRNNYAALAERMADALRENTAASREVVRCLRLRPCLADERRPDLPGAETTALVRKDMTHA